jgi:acyl carrier protein
VAPAPEQEILAHAASRLPGYMLPAVLVRLEALPLTANGKVDRRNLPEPGRPAAGTGTGTERPEPDHGTERERQLCVLFAEILGLEAVGVNDSFFEIGGHSLRAVRLLSRIRRVFGVEIGIRTLFNAPTPALLAQQFGTDQVAATTRPALVPRAMSRPSQLDPQRQADDAGYYVGDQVGRRARELEGLDTGNQLGEGFA